MTQIQKGFVAVGSFRDLDVWQRSVEMTVALNRLTWSFPKEERYGLTSELRRASVFVSGSIAESWGHRSDGQFVSFLGRARKSIMDVQRQLRVAGERGLGDMAIRHQAQNLSCEVGNLLTSMMN